MHIQLCPPTGLFFSFSFVYSLETLEVSPSRLYSYPLLAAKARCKQALDSIIPEGEQSRIQGNGSSLRENKSQPRCRRAGVQLGGD